MATIREDALAYQKNARHDPNLQTLIFIGIGRLIGGTFRLLWSWRVSIAWLFLILLLSSVNHWLTAFGIAVTVAAIVWDKSRPYSFGVCDWKRFANKRRVQRQLARGNVFLRESGLVGVNDETQYLAFMDSTPEEVTFELKRPLVGVPTTRIVEACRAFKDRHDAKSMQVVQMGRGAVRVVFYLVDPLDEAQTIHEPAPFDAEKMSVQCAVDAMGDPFSVSFREVSGMVVAGMPGSGKTAGATSFLLPLALSGDVELRIIDGKGGADWTAYEPVAREFISGDEDLAPIRDLLQREHAAMIERVATNVERLGNSNFWNASLTKRRAADVRLRLLIIDECQGLFETAGRNSKEDRELQGQILRYASALVKRGRSAGVSVVFITQKPTAESLPTAIRDNAALRLAFRVSTADAERAVMGTFPEDDPDLPRAVHIPSQRKGGAVMATETGEFKAVRFFYMPEEEQRELLAKGVKS